jgi:hypothetical protein
MAHGGASSAGFWWFFPGDSPNKALNCWAKQELPMRSILMSLVFVVAFMLLPSTATFPRQAGQRQGGRGAAQTEAKSTEPFDPHDLNGIWLLRTPYAGLSNQPPPLTPWGQTKFMANKPSYGPRAVPPSAGNDAIGNCDPIGFPRNLFSPSRPVQFIQLPNELLQVFQYHSVWRQIWTDGRQVPKDLDPTWYGFSTGKWEGDTFAVNTVDLDERTWLDHFGYPHSADMKVEERYHRTDHDTFELIVTVDDPKTYTKPWVSDKKIFKLNAQQQLDEEYCVPSEEQFFNQHTRDVAGGKAK